MSQQVTRIAPLPAAKIFGAMYLIIGLLFAPLFALPALFAGSEAQPFGLGFALLIPVLYAIMGFLGMALFCWLYNVIAARLGGIELEFGAGA